jgi:chromosome segregation ATPase
MTETREGTDVVERLNGMLSPGGTPACVAEAANLIQHLRKVLSDARAERARLVDQMARCDAMLDEVGMPHDHHAEDRPLTLDERVECLVAEMNDLQDGDDTAWWSRYTAAVNGRREFRKAYREARDDVARLRAENEALKEALCDLSIFYGDDTEAREVLRSDFTGPEPLLMDDDALRESVWNNAREALSKAGGPNVG